MKTAVLILDEYIKRGNIENSYYDRYLNTGIKLILDVLTENVDDFQFDYINLISADEYDVILVIISRKELAYWSEKIWVRNTLMRAGILERRIPRL